MGSVTARGPRSAINAQNMENVERSIEEVCLHGVVSYIKTWLLLEHTTKLTSKAGHDGKISIVIVFVGF